MANEEFGKQCMFFLCSFSGPLPKDKCFELAKAIIESAGMKPSHDPVVFDYGAVLGYIIVAPLIESMVFIDYWIGHGGGYLTLDSCKAFYPHRIITTLEKAGLTVQEHRTTGLSLR